jgi:hypothetical protein
MPGAPNVLDYINTSIAIATFLISERLPATIETIRSYFVRKEERAPEGFLPEEAQSFISLLVIDKELLDDLTEKVKNSIDDYRDCLRKATRRQERDACDSRVEKDVCDNLNRIRGRNKGDLPTDYLNNQWDSFGCERV